MEFVYVYIPDVYELAHVARWRPYSLRDLAQASCSRSVLCTDSAQRQVRMQMV